MSKETFVVFIDNKPATEPVGSVRAAIARADMQLKPGHTGEVRSDWTSDGTYWPDHRGRIAAYNERGRWTVESRQPRPGQQRLPFREVYTPPARKTPNHPRVVPARVAAGSYAASCTQLKVGEKALAAERARAETSLRSLSTSIARLMKMDRHHRPATAARWRAAMEALTSQHTAQDREIARMSEQRDSFKALRPQLCTRRR